VQDGFSQRNRIRTPEQRIPDDQGRHTEYTAGYDLARPCAQLIGA